MGVISDFFGHLPQAEREYRRIDCNLNPETVFSRLVAGKNSFAGVDNSRKEVNGFLCHDNQKNDERDYEEGLVALVGSSVHPGGRWSFFAVEPLATIVCRKNSSIIRSFGRKLEIQGNSIEHLQDFVAPFAVPPSNTENSAGLNNLKEPGDTNEEGEKPPFSSGAVVALSYDLMRLVENIPVSTVDDTAVPDIWAGIYDTVLALDMQNRVAWLCRAHWPGFSGGDAREARLLRALSEHEPEFVREAFTAEIKSDCSRQQYIESARKVLRYLRDGHVYQVNLSQRFSADWNAAPAELFLRLREINPSPFSAYISLFDGSAICSSSPERLLEKRGNVLRTCPIKGTRPRVNSIREDESFIRELKSSSKDMAELSMIVDLERNDLGKICKAGTVKVDRHAELLVLPTVHHLYSVVEGELNNTGDADATVADIGAIIKAVFPGGSITGVPKLRAMEIIEELEIFRRGFYTGSIGYVDTNGDMDLNIAIRTATVSGKKVYYSAGGGIVLDSEPEAEWQETLDKGKALMSAISDFQR